MGARRKKLYFLIFLLLVFLPYRTTSADTSPKPSMKFAFVREGGEVTITSGILYECHKTDCSDAEPLKELGPQRFGCDASSCGAMAYGFSPYHKLMIRFSDGKTLQSNIFETQGFNSRHKVTVRENDLLVEGKFSSKFSLNPKIIFLLVCANVLACAILLVV